jgi:hypothetical protein
LIINAKVYKAKKDHKCDDCKKTIFKGEYYLYLYGMAETGDTLWSFKECKVCGTMKTPSKDEKYLKVKEELRSKYLQDLPDE